MEALDHSAARPRYQTLSQSKDKVKLIISGMTFLSKIFLVASSINYFYGVTIAVGQLTWRHVEGKKFQ